MRARASLIFATLGRGGIAFGTALLPADALACAVCLGWSDGGGLNGGFYWSALLLTALPFAVMGALGLWVDSALRRARRRDPGPVDPRAAEE